jgi:hypothetical protein
VFDLEYVKPVHVASYIESLREGFAKPTIKQHLAAIRMLFDWLVVGQIIDANPAHAVRGPKQRRHQGPHAGTQSRGGTRPALLHRVTAFPFLRYSTGIDCRLSVRIPGATYGQYPRRHPRRVL